MAVDDKRFEDLRTDHYIFKDEQMNRWDKHYDHHEARDKEKRGFQRNSLILVITVVIGLIVDILFNFL